MWTFLCIASESQNVVPVTVKRCLESGTDAQEPHVLKPNLNTIKADRRKATYSWSRQASPPKTGIHTTSKMISKSPEACWLADQTDHQTCKVSELQGVPGSSQHFCLKDDGEVEER